MSWVDNIRCLYCDGRLPLYRKITNGQFCSSAHRKAYWQEQERLAVERLHQTHDSLRAYRPAGPIEAILGRTQPAPEAERPRWMTLANTGEFPPVGFCPDPTPLHAHWLPDHLAGADALPADGAQALRRPVFIYGTPDTGFASAGLIAVPLSGRDSKILTLGVVERAVWQVHPVSDLPLDFTIDGDAVGELGQAVQEQIPDLAGLLALLPPASRSTAISVVRLDSLPLAARVRTQLPFYSTAFLDRTCVPMYAASLPLPVGGAVNSANAGALTDGARAIDIGAKSTTPELSLSRTCAPMYAASLRLPVGAAVNSANAGALTDGARAIDIGAKSTTPQLSLSRTCVPMCAAALPLPVGSMVNSANSPADGAHAIDTSAKSTTPQLSLSRTCVPMCAASLPLPVGGAVNSANSPADGAHAIDIGAKSTTPELSLSTPPLRPRLRLTAGSRYPVRVQPPVSHTGELSALPAAPGIASLPQHGAKVAPARDAKQTAPPGAMQEPNRAGPVALPRTAMPSAPEPAPTAAGTSSIPQPPRTEPMQPQLRAAPINEMGGPTAPPGFAIFMPPYTPLEAPAENSQASLWAHASDFLSRAPRDLKLLAIAIPVLLGLALHPALPKVRVASTANTSGMQHSFERAMNTQWTNVRQSLVDRAAVALDEDFRAGLDDWASRWTTRGEGNAEWSFDATGFVRPGPLALYKPSVGLTDYQMQFLGMIDKKALSWVVRAADFDNFYVVKLQVLKAGPLPSIGVTRYAVVNGKADSRVDTVVPIDARADTLYRVLMDIHGDDFTLTVQGHLVDSWSDARLKHGGIGFFNARGEDSRVRWVQVTHQYDMLGRLCAYLAPYNIPSSSGSF